MNLEQTLWIFIFLALFLTSIQCSENNTNETELDEALTEIRDKAAVNCTSFIPAEIQQLMWKHDPPNVRSRGQMYALVEYLLACLLAKLPNVKDSSPFAFISDPTIAYNVGLNQVVSLGFDGILTTKMMIITRWLDRRLQWFTNTSIKNWKFDSFLYYPPSNVWVPRFRLANCQSNKCGINSNESNLLTLYNNGIISLESEITLGSSCDLNFTWFPFDEQNCSLEFIETEMRGGSRINLTRGNFAWVYYIAENEEWIVSFFGHHPHPHKARVMNYWTKGKWNSTSFSISNLSFTINILLNRRPEYYVFNLLVPMLLVSFTGIASVFISFESEGRLNMALTVVLTFIFLQTLIASMSPKTSSSPLVCDMPIILIQYYSTISQHLCVHLQVATYILYSLLLAAFHVCACAIMSKIHALSNDTKPGFFVRLVFVDFTSGGYWIKLFKRCYRNCTIRDVPRNYDSSASAQHTERLSMPSTHAMHSLRKVEEISMINKEMKFDSEMPAYNIVDKNEKQLEVLHTWNDVALGINRLITLFYLLSNLLVFALYMCPLLLRIIYYSSVSEYVTH